MMNTFAASTLASLVLLAGTALAQSTTAPSKIEPAPVQVKEPAKAEAKTTLNVGDKAPALEVQKFLKGDPITGFEKGKVYVVEFWATWCGPCIKAFPHLSKLQTEYKDKGVTFVGVNIWERPYNDKTLDKVTKFVEDQGDKMAYTVAYDGPDKKSDSSWMKAAGQNGIPHAFIVDQDGVIAWAGHPMGMDQPLAKIVAKEWDIKAAKETAEKERAEAEKYRKEGAERAAKNAEANKKLNEALKAEKWDEAITQLDAMKANVTPTQAGMMEVTKFNILLTKANQPEKAYAMKDTLLAAKGVGDNAQRLNDLAWRVLDDESVKTRNVDFAFDLATKANDLSKGEDGAILDTLARAYFDKGDKAKAIETQTKAIEKLKAAAIKDPDMAEMLPDMEAALKKYKGE